MVKYLSGRLATTRSHHTEGARSMKNLFFGLIVYTLVGVCSAEAEGQSVRFSDDVLVSAGYGFHAEIEALNISVQDNECLVVVYFPDGELFTHQYDGYEFQLISIDGKPATFYEVISFAKSICWTSS